MQIFMFVYHFHAFYFLSLITDFGVPSLAYSELRA